MGPGNALGNHKNGHCLNPILPSAFLSRMMIFLLDRVAGPLDRETKAEMNEETDPKVFRPTSVPCLGREGRPRKAAPEQQPFQTPAAFEGLYHGLPSPGGLFQCCHWVSQQFCCEVQQGVKQRWWLSCSLIWQLPLQ